MALIKNDNKQKKHKGENIIGKIIYGFLLFAPLLNILFTTLYGTFNKNAYRSYSGEAIGEKQYTYLTTQDTIDTTTRYYLDLNRYTQPPQNSQMYIENVIVENQGQLSNANVTNLESYPQYRVVSYTGQNKIEYYGIQNASSTWLFSGNPTTEKYTISFNIVNITSGPDWWKPLLYTVNATSLTYIDNAMELGIYKTEQSNLYNWSKETGTYTVLENTCNLLGITNTFTPMLLAYWLIISVIYFIYDIALILVWMVHKKIHELTDAL